jgi:hypothetical protein
MVRITFQGIQEIREIQEMNYILDNQEEMTNNIILNQEILTEIRKRYRGSDQELDDAMEMVDHQPSSENIRYYHEIVIKRQALVQEGEKAEKLLQQLIKKQKEATENLHKWRYLSMILKNMSQEYQNQEI